MRELLELYFCFFRIGLVTFGGGYAMLPILQHDLADKKHWATSEELMDYFAIGQCTPGIIAVNVSTFIGNKRKGAPGGFIATLGFITGPVVILIVISAFLKSFSHLQVIRDAFAGVRVCVCVLILMAVLRLWKRSVIDRVSLILYIVIFFLVVFSGQLPFSVPAAVLVIAAGLFGILFGKEKEAVSEAKKQAPPDKKEEPL